MIRIGIDPDSKSIGVAILENGKIRIEKYRIYDFLYEIIPMWERLYKEFCRQGKFGEMKIYLEGGWLNNHYAHSTESIMIVSNISRKIGMNHQVGLIIEETLYNKEFKYETVKPVSVSKYKPLHEKINHNQMCQMLDDFGVEYKFKKSNQDERDSVLLLMHYEFERQPENSLKKM